MSLFVICCRNLIICCGRFFNIFLLMLILRHIPMKSILLWISIWSFSSENVIVFLLNREETCEEFLRIKWYSAKEIHYLYLKYNIFLCSFPFLGFGDFGLTIGNFVPISNIRFRTLQRPSPSSHLPLNTGMSLSDGK